MLDFYNPHPILLLLFLLYVLGYATHHYHYPGVTPGDYIVHTEDCVESIYFVVKGHLKILKDGAVIGILSE